MHQGIRTLHILNIVLQCFVLHFLYLLPQINVHVSGLSLCFILLHCSMIFMNFSQQVSYALKILRVLIEERIYFSLHSCFIYWMVVSLRSAAPDAYEIFNKVSFLKFTLSRVCSTCLPLKQISPYLIPIAYCFKYSNTKTGQFGQPVQKCLPIPFEAFSSYNGRHAE